MASTMLLIDGGQSHCRAVEVRDGVAGEVVRLPGLPRIGRRYDELRALVAARDVELVAAGLTGYRGEPIDWPAPRVIVTNDAVTAYLGALGETPGAVIAAGTGAIALASDGARWARADGHGTLLGDHGGGFWIGRRALSLALRGAAPDLLERARARFGNELVRAIYDSADPTATIAGFAPEVAAAAREGDPIAARIWQDAGAELARTVTDALQRVAGPPVVSWSGGVFGAGDLIREPLEAALGFALRAPLGDPLAGVARLAAGTDLFPSLIGVFA